MKSIKIEKSITQREDASLDKYLQEIGKEKLLSIDEEVELAQRIKNGDKSALDKLVRANLRFVVSIAKQYQNQGLPLSDLINEGNIGLMIAAKKFDETRGFKFISYAVWWIRQSVIYAINEQSRVIHLPLSQMSSLNKINKMMHYFEQEKGREPSLEEVSTETDFSIEKIQDVFRISKKHISIDNFTYAESSETLLDTLVNENSLCPDSSLITESLKNEINRALDTLSRRESKVIRMSFGLKEGYPRMSNLEIADYLDLTPERVRQIKVEALRKLKRSYRKKLLAQFLG